MTKKSAKTATKKPAAKAAPKKKVVSPEDKKVAKTQLVEKIADNTGLTKRQSEEAVSAILDSIINALRTGKSVGLPGLGTLSVKATAARTGVRPGTSEKISIPAGKKVSFKVASTLKSGL